MIPRLIATDLDGTLLTPQQTISDRTVAALTAAREAGVTVVFATGRSHFSALPIIDERDVVDWLVCSNGATVWHPQRAEVHRRMTLADEIISPLFDSVRSAFPSAAFAWETSQGFLWDEEWGTLEQVAQDYPARATRVVRSGALPSDVTKVLLGVPGFPPPDLVDPVRELISADVAVSTSGAPFVEITHAQAHKGGTLAWLTAELGVEAHEVIAFGDSYNDTTMLEWAGHAVVIEHAPDEVKTLADEIAPSNTNDGVAQVIERLLGS